MVNLGSMSLHFTCVHFITCLPLPRGIEVSSIGVLLLVRVPSVITDGDNHLSCGQDEVIVHVNHTHCIVMAKVCQ